MVLTPYLMVGMMDTFHTWYIELSYGEKKPFVCGGGQRSFDVTRGQKLKPCKCYSSRYHTFDNKHVDGNTASRLIVMVLVAVKGYLRSLEVKWHKLYKLLP